MLVQYIYSATTFTSSKNIDALLVARKEVGIHKKFWKKLSIYSQFVKGTMNKFKVTTKINFAFLEKTESRLHY
jgi:hypothetical protein